MIVVRPEGSEVSDLEFLTRLERLEEHIKSYSEDGHRPVGHVESLLDVARESWRALHGNQGDFYRLPETKRGAKDVVSLFQMSSPERTARLVTVDQQTMSLEVHLDWMMGERYRRFVEYVEQGIGRFIGDVASTRLTGTSYQSVQVEFRLVRELSQSFLIAFVIISTLMCLLLRSVKLGLLSMLPNALPAVFVLGMMTLRGTPLDLTHVLLASVVLGVAVDDTVHLFHGYIVRRRAGYASEAAIRDTFGAVGRAAILSTVVLSLGMLLYTGSSMSTVRSFGLLAGLAVIVALVADLVVLPALLRVLARNEAGPERTAPAEVAHAR